MQLLYGLAISALVVFLAAPALQAEPPFTDKEKEATEVQADSGQDLLTAREVKKQLRKEARAERKAKRKAKFLGWVARVFSGADDTELIIAILLTLFVGGLGIHRVYLKSEPIIILWYFISFGGFFGLIPLIDLIRIAMGDLDHYRGNNSFFACFQ